MTAPPGPPGRRLLLPRRRFLAAASAAIVVSACGGSSGSDEDAAAQEPLAIDDFLLLQAGFADGYRAPSTLAAGTTGRAPFFLYGGSGQPVVNGLPESLSGELILPDDTAAPVTLVRRGEGVPSPYFVLEFDAALPGDYELHVVVNDEQQRTDFRVAPPDEVGLVQIGESLRSVATPTFDDARGFDPICTRFDPCPFHEINLAAAIGNGRPKALLVATPGYCQTSICGPSVELLIELDPSATVDTIHAEVYTEPGRADELGGFFELVGPIAETYEMIFEPSFIVADADDVVTARLDFTFDRSEMADALATVL